MCMHACVYIPMCTKCRCQQRPEVLHPSGAEVTGNCELPDMGTEN